MIVKINTPHFFIRYNLAEYVNLRSFEEDNEVKAKVGLSIKCVKSHSEEYA